MTFVILYGTYLTYLPFLMENAFEASPLVIGMTMSASSLATALTSTQLGKLARRYSDRTLLEIASLLSVMRLLMIPHSPSLLVLVIPAILFGVAPGIEDPQSAGTSGIRRGAVTSANALVLRAGPTLGPPLMGVVASVGRIAGPFYAAAAIAAAMFPLTTTVNTEEEI